MKEKINKILIKIKNNEFWNKLLKNFLYAVVGEGGASCINLLVVILLIKLIGNDGYGTLILAQSYMLIMDLLINLQCWKGVIKYGETALVENDIEMFCGYVKLGTILDISTAILGAIISFYMVNLIGSLSGWSNTMLACSKIFSLVILFHFSGTPTAILRLENKFNLVSIQKITAALFKLISIVILLLFKGHVSILFATLIYACTDIVGHLILTIMSLVVVHKKYGIRKTIKAKIPSKFKEFTKFTFWTTLSDAVDIPVQYFDVFIVSQLGVDIVSVFKFFKQIISIFSKLTTPLYQAIYPQFSNLVASGKREEAYRIVNKIRNLILKYGLISAILFGVSSYWWLGIIVDELYVQYWYILAIYLVVHMFALSYTTIHPYFVALGQVFNSFKYVLISNILYLLVAYVITLKFGLIGSVIAYLVQFSTVIFLKNRKIKKILVSKGAC